ncbi:conserved hypothetical protein [Alteromonas sp. 38]|uniref:hypothetical protein n=1 Tax=Alteromonas TaxID=226 RepID=UPI0012F454DB|nr:MULTISPECIES: hypothetical protein [Alteromonas]CAD5249934.1 conserved hypothetical protein [Alteromonas sp. 154]VXC42175.1 conserved hypothetical protein [Alteromonas sp. 38]
MQHNTHSYTQENTQNGSGLHLETQELLQVTGGKSGVSAGADKDPIRFVKPPVYITLAIGEDGGQLPDLLS